MPRQIYWINYYHTQPTQTCHKPENSLDPFFCLPVHQDLSIWSSVQIVSDPGQPKAPEDHPVLSLILQLLAEVYFSHLAIQQLYYWMNPGALLVMLFPQKGLWLHSGNRKKNPTPNYSISTGTAETSFRTNTFHTLLATAPAPSSTLRPWLLHTSLPKHPLLPTRNKVGRSLKQWLPSSQPNWIAHVRVKLFPRLSLPTI